MRTRLALILIAASISTFLSTYLTGSVNMAPKAIGAEFSPSSVSGSGNSASAPSS